jgi:NAD(P)-dependent dehydrogenase (short-subunit alcohol dehydrogenase family)
MKTVQGKVAAITGAGSGIGRSTAILLAREGCHLSLSDIDEASVQETASSCHGVKVTTARVDVANRDAMQKWCADTIAAHGRANIIINNAGVAMGATVESMAYDDLEWLMGINFWGVVYGTKEFLPHIKRTGDGHIVNISSVFGLIGVPTQSAYNAAKFAVRGFTESLREEMEVEGSGVGVTSVHPGGIKTNIARRARMKGGEDWGVADGAAAGERFEKMAKTTPDDAARDILAAILGNRARQLIGRDAVIIDLMQRLLPVSYQRVLIGAAKRQRRAAKSR